jgi:hypothetical protein
VAVCQKTCVIRVLGGTNRNRGLGLSGDGERNCHIPIRHVQIKTARMAGR